jgi:hypothetical protein
MTAMVTPERPRVRALSYAELLMAAPGWGKAPTPREGREELLNVRSAGMLAIHGVRFNVSVILSAAHSHSMNPSTGNGR